MVNIILGLKGSGKTKKLVDLVRDAVNQETGDVVVIERERKLTFDIPYQARLIDAGNYDIGSYEFLKGIICGVHAGNYDITHFFIDNFYKLVNDKSVEALEAFLAWLDKFSEQEKISFIISISADPDTVSDKRRSCWPRGSPSRRPCAALSRSSTCRPSVRPSVSTPAARP